MFYLLLSTLCSTIVFTLYHRVLSMIFACLTIPSYCPVYEHIEEYMANTYSGRQIEIDNESRITIARNAVSWIWYNGQLFCISYIIDEGAHLRMRRFVIWALRRSTLENFVADMYKIHGITDVVQVRTAGTYDWQVKQCPIRPISSILPPAPIDAMIADAQQFVKSRQRYVDLGIPYRRGYLLHGDPGTGKSSCAYALASVLKRPLCFLSLTNKHVNDEWLIDILSRAPSGAIILVDDFDRFVPSTDNTGVTLCGLLNALDGVVAQTGRIVILVANDISRISDAVLRPGRIDRHFHFNLTAVTDATTLFERFHGSEYKDLFAENFGHTTVRSAASIVSYLMRYECAHAAAINAGTI
jgi:mitochondrial chaperone BCS1